MRAVTWHGKRDVRVDTVPDPTIREPTDIVIKVTSTAICGSDLHLYDVLGMWLDEGDILGHEPMGIVEEVGSAVRHVAPGDRVVIPFNISCGHCFMCDRDLYAQCETTQVTQHGKGAALFGYTKLYGQVPGGQAQYLRVPHGDFGPVKVPHDHPDERFLYLSDILPTAWQAVRFADVGPGCTVVVHGLGPVGQFCVRIARVLGAERVIGIDMVAERLELARRHGAETIDLTEVDDVAKAVMATTDGRGAECVIDAVGMEAHGTPILGALQKGAGFLPGAAAQRLTTHIGVDRLGALYSAMETVRRGGTLSIVGVYGGQSDPFPMMDLFDKGITIRMGQAHVRRWTDEILGYLTRDDDPLGVEDLASHRLSLEQAPDAYEMFQLKADGAVKVVLDPWA